MPLYSEDEGVSKTFPVLFSDGSGSVSIGYLDGDRPRSFQIMMAGPLDLGRVIFLPDGRYIKVVESRENGNIFVEKLDKKPENVEIVNLDSSLPLATFTKSGLGALEKGKVVMYNKDG